MSGLPERATLRADRRAPARDLLRLHRRRVHAHRGARAARLAAGDAWSRRATTRPSSARELLRILTKLTDAEIFEQFIHKNYVGAKRFSLEGAESMIPMIDLLIESGGHARHRGAGHRHGAPRAPQRARQRDGQERARDLRGVRRQAPRAIPRRGRREVPPRLLERRLDAVAAGTCTCRWRSTRATWSG